MMAGLRLDAIRVRDDSIVRIEVALLARASENSWRAHVMPPEKVEVGDRLRFGEESESLACFLGFLDADIIEKNGAILLLSFHFTGAALDEALQRLSMLANRPGADG